MNQTEKRIISRVLLGIFLGVLVYCLASQGVAQAGFISGFPNAPGGLESHTNPDITSYGLSVSYNSGTSTFSASNSGAFSSLINDGNESLDSGDGNLSLSVVINPSTGAPLSGSFSISGDAYGGNSGNLLTGTILQFGFAPSSGPTSAQNNVPSEHFQFIFSTTGGDLAAYYPQIAVNMTVVNLSINGGSFATSGTFATSFSDTSGNAQTDTYVSVPEPSTLLLGFIGMCALTVSFKFLRE